MGAAAAAKSLQSCPTLCDPTDSSPPGSPVPGILQARVLERGAIASSVEWERRSLAWCCPCQDPGCPQGRRGGAEAEICTCSGWGAGVRAGAGGELRCPECGASGCRREASPRSPDLGWHLLVGAGPARVALRGIQCVMGVGLEEVVCSEIRDVGEGRLHFPRLL